jgi:hypothetical protein
VKEVKHFLEAREEISQACQELLYQGQAMDDERTLLSYGPLEEGQLSVVVVVRGEVDHDDPSTFPVHVRTMMGRQATFFITSSWKVAELKWMVQCDWGLVCDHQRLIFDMERLKDGKTFSDYAVSADSLIHLAPVM